MSTPTHTLTIPDLSAPRPLAPSRLVPHLPSTKRKFLPVKVAADHVEGHVRLAENGFIEGESVGETMFFRVC